MRADREKRLASEKELLDKQMALLRESLEARTEELATLRRHNSSQILQLQTDLANKIDQVRCRDVSVLGRGS